MEKIKVQTSALLDRLRENRNNHREIFERALAIYREAVIEELEKMLDNARRGKKIQRSVNLIEPMDQTKDYDRAITMLEMSIEDEIEISESEFACYVMDDWRWKEQFTTTNSVYLS